MNQSTLDRIGRTIVLHNPAVVCYSSYNAVLSIGSQSLALFFFFFQKAEGVF